MLKRISKKVLSVIIATMLVANMSAVNTSAVEENTEENVASIAIAGGYLDETTGVRLESSIIDLNSKNVNITDTSEYEGDFYTGFFLKNFQIDIYENPDWYQFVGC